MTERTLAARAVGARLAVTAGVRAAWRVVVTSIAHFRAAVARLTIRLGTTLGANRTGGAAARLAHVRQTVVRRLARTACHHLGALPCVALLAVAVGVGEAPGPSVALSADAFGAGTGDTFSTGHAAVAHGPWTTGIPFGAVARCTIQVVSARLIEVRHRTRRRFTTSRRAVCVGDTRAASVGRQAGGIGARLGGAVRGPQTSVPWSANRAEVTIAGVARTVVVGDAAAVFAAGATHAGGRAIEAMAIAVGCARRAREPRRAFAGAEVAIAARAIVGFFARLALTRAHTNPERTAVSGETVAACAAARSEVTRRAVWAAAIAVRFSSVRAPIVTRRLGVCAVPVVTRLRRALVVASAGFVWSAGARRLARRRRGAARRGGCCVCRRVAGWPGVNEWRSARDLRVGDVAARCHGVFRKRRIDGGHRCFVCGSLVQRVTGVGTYAWYGGQKGRLGSRRGRFRRAARGRLEQGWSQRIRRRWRRFAFAAAGAEAEREGRQP